MSIFDPYRPQHPLMAQAWVDCLRWAVTEPDIIAAFQTETGLTWEPPRPTLDRMIDQATGAGEAVTRQFLAWFNEHVWGVDEAGQPNDIRLRESHGA